MFSGSKVYHFNCFSKINPCGPGETDSSICSVEIEADGPVPYDITIKTCDEGDSGTNKPILFDLLGTKGFAQTKLMTEKGYTTGSSHTKKIYVNDVGEVTGFKLRLADSGRWNPCLVIVKNVVTKILKTYALSNVMLINPGNDVYILDSNEKKPQDDSKDDSSSGQSLDVNNPDGGLIEFTEAKSK